MSSLQSYFVKTTMKFFTRHHQGLDKNNPYSIEQIRQSFDQACQQLPVPSKLKVRYDSLNDVPVAWLNMPESKPERLMVFFHGGGYCLGTLKGYLGLGARLAKYNTCQVLLVDYRLAPEHPCPAAIEDAIAAYKGVLKNYLPHQIILAGDSAGGGLICALLQALKERMLSMPAATILMSPWTDLRGTSPSIEQKNKIDPVLNSYILERLGILYRGDIPTDDPMVSPLLGNFSDFPPSLIQVGTEEVLLDDSRQLAEQLEAVNRHVQLEIFDGMFHVWQLFAAFLPEAKTALLQIAAFTDKQWQQHMYSQN
ncbi:MAG: alpha/beta hydrolase [Bacteroidota bacterium]